ncbi:MAG: YicC/YloC family endoribonuclease [Thermodesulfobacteriota bacterium]
MIKSMTAYGRGEAQSEETHYVSEIRSLNNRYRDIIIRMPKPLQPLEEELRSLVASRIRRGRVEVSMTMENGGIAPSLELELNEPLVDSYMELARQLSNRAGVALEVRLDTLLAMKDVISVKPATVDLDKTRWGLEEALKLSLNSLDGMKIREGGVIEADFFQRLQKLAQYVDEIHNRAPHLVDAYRKRLQENVQQMTNGMSVDETRLAQEVAVYADRSDITEEIVRIKSHIKQFETYLGIDDAVGRRLDFLIQEMNREVNTLSAKGSDAMVSRVAVEMKAELEKLREQVQNVE